MWFFRDHQLLVFLLSPSLSSAYYQLALLLLLHERVDWTWRLCINSGPALPTPPPILIWYYQKKKKRRKKPFPHMHYSFFFVPVQSDGPTRSCNFFVFQIFLPPLQSWGVIFHISLTFFGCCWRFFLPWLIHQVTPPLPYVNLFKF